MRVTLVSCTPNAERVAAAAYKICYSPVGAADLMDNLEGDKAAAFLEKMSDIGHESPIEHVSFTFAIEGVSRSLLAQITRHRIASFSVQSQRYVKKEGFAYVTPPEIENDERAKRVYADTMEYLQDRYYELTEILTEKHLDKMEKQGMDREKCRAAAQKMAIEDARFVLPNACDTKMLVTLNARSLRNFFKIRCCNRAQWEIRELAWDMLALCRREAPTLFAKCGPACLFGPCPEGKMTCGLSAEVIERGKACGR